MIGFLFTFLPFVYLFAVYGTSLSTDFEEISGTFYIMFAVYYFTYRMLDEIDGKQARRTGNSSPLGMLFDHGCDAFSTGFILTTTAKCLNFGDNIYTLMFIAMSCATFHFSTLEEYYVGGLFLGPGNAITDFSVVVYALYISLGIFGNEFCNVVVFEEGDMFKGSRTWYVRDCIMFGCFAIQTCTILAW